MKAEEAYKSVKDRGGYAGYKLIDVDDIPWTICQLHGEAHPVDFPCTGCRDGVPIRVKPTLRSET